MAGFSRYPTFSEIGANIDFINLIIFGMLWSIFGLWPLNVVLKPNRIRRINDPPSRLPLRTQRKINIHLLLVFNSELKLLLALGGEQV